MEWGDRGKVTGGSRGTGGGMGGRVKWAEGRDCRGNCPGKGPHSGLLSFGFGTKFSVGAQWPFTNARLFKSTSSLSTAQG
jgi:hypothetical protein